MQILDIRPISYSVSHDLMTLLRRINGFSRTILETSTDKIDDQSKNYFRVLSIVLEARFGLKEK